MRDVKTQRDREYTSARTILKRYVIDDGWNVPEEIIADIELKIEQSWDEAVREVEMLKRKHKGNWITMGIAQYYRQLAAPFLAFHDRQYVQTIRELGVELRKKYGVTELEAINILNGYHLKDYVNKYYMIRNLIPAGFDAQSICDMVLSEYGYPHNEDRIAL